MVGGKGPLTAEGIKNEAGHFFVEEEPEAIVGYVNKWGYFWRPRATSLFFSGHNIQIKIFS